MGSNLAQFNSRLLDTDLAYNSPLLGDNYALYRVRRRFTLGALPSAGGGGGGGGGGGEINARLGV